VKKLLLILSIFLSFGLIFLLFIVFSPNLNLKKLLLFNRNKNEVVLNNGSPFAKLISEKEDTSENDTPSQGFWQSLWGTFYLLEAPKDLNSYKSIQLQEGQVIGLINSKTDDIYNITVLNSFDNELFPINSQKEIIHCNDKNTQIGRSNSTSNIDPNFTIEQDKNALYIMSIFCKDDREGTNFLDRCYIHIYE